MATESPLIHDGSQNTLSTASDARRSSITGTTLAGPNGSGQFLFVTQSTTVDRTVGIASTAPTANVGNNNVYGILQNTPAPGQAADVGIFGLSKVVCGTTSFVRGALLVPSSTSGGTVTVYSTATVVYNPVGWALETPSTVSQVITMMLAPFIKGSTT